VGRCANKEKEDNFLSCVKCPGEGREKDTKSLPQEPSEGKKNLFGARNAGKKRKVMVEKWGSEREKRGRRGQFFIRTGGGKRKGIMRLAG